MVIEDLGRNSYFVCYRIFNSGALHLDFVWRHQAWCIRCNAAAKSAAPRGRRLVESRGAHNMTYCLGLVLSNFLIPISTVEIERIMGQPGSPTARIDNAMPTGQPGFKSENN